MEIISLGLKPLIQELEVCQGYLQPMHAEKFWIYQYKKVFRHPVTNGNIDLTRIKRPPKSYARNRVWW